MSGFIRTYSDALVHDAAASALPLRRWAALSSLLLIELLVLSISFDTSSIGGFATWLAAILGNANLIVQFAISSVVAAVMFNGHRLAVSAVVFTAKFEHAAFSWLPLLLHSAAFLIFYRLSAILFAPNLPDQSEHSLYLIGWITTGGVTLMTWLACAFPVSLWSSLFRSASKFVLLGSIVALASVAAGQIADLLWLPLARSTFWIVEQLLTLVYSSTISKPSELEIGTNAFTVEIAPGCSGYEGIGLILAFVGMFLWWFRSEFRFPRSFLLLPIGVSCIWVLNAVRIAALIVIGSSISPALAAGGFHSQAGWLAFNAVAIALCTAAWKLRYFRIESAAVAKDEITTSPGNFAAPYLVPFLLLILVTMGTQALSFNNFDRFYAFRVLAVAGALWYFRRQYLADHLFGWTFAWQPIALGLAICAVWIALEPLSGIDSQSHSATANGLLNFPAPVAAAWLLFRALGSVVTVPIVEELAFRGYLTRRLIAEQFQQVPIGKFTWFSFLGSSVVFGLLHGRWLAGIVAGMLLATALYRRRQLMDAVVAHATANGLITAYVLATGNWAAWS